MDTYFERKQYKELISWNAMFEKPPLLVTGMRGVGKTSLVAHFASETHRRYIYIDFRSDGLIREYIALQRYIGKGDDAPTIPELVIKYLETEQASQTDGAFEEESVNSPQSDILFIFDGIEYNSEIEKELFLEAEKGEYEKLSVILISDIIQNSDYPEFSRIKTLHLYPLDFEEYLLATDHEWYRDVIRAHYENRKRIPSLIHDDLCDLVDTFMQIGGMPMVVRASLMNSDGEVSASLYRTAYNDVLCSISELTDEKESTRTRKIYDAAYEQLLRNSKLKYTEIQNGTSLNYFSSAIKRLIKSGLITPVYEKKEGDIRKKHFETGIRLYPVDSGFCGWKLLSLGKDKEQRIKEECLVCYIANELSKSGHELFSWRSEGKAEIRLLMKNNPIEIEELVKKQKKSINEYKNRHQDFEYELHISHKNFDFNDKEIFIPLYALFCL